MVPGIGHPGMMQAVIKEVIFDSLFTQRRATEVDGHTEGRAEFRGTKLAKGLTDPPSPRAAVHQFPADWLEETGAKRIWPPQQERLAKGRGVRFLFFFRVHSVAAPLSHRCHLPDSCCHTPTLVHLRLSSPFFRGGDEIVITELN